MDESHLSSIRMHTYPTKSIVVYLAVKAVLTVGGAFCVTLYRVVQCRVVTF
jgi:hypothetical protein